MKYIVFEKSSGRIVRTGECVPDMFDIQAGEGESVMEGSADDMNEYVLNGVVTSRPEMEAELCGQKIICPRDTVARIEGFGTYNLTDGELELELDEPGEYRVHLERFPFKEMTIVVAYEG